MNKLQLLICKVLQESNDSVGVYGSPQIASSQFSGDRYAVNPQTGKSDMRLPHVLGSTIKRTFPELTTFGKKSRKKSKRRKRHKN